MATDLILGTAGHIDHGKTALVKALTGIDTDRLPEERRRGITIELGFAQLVLGDARLGIVDVPGHERFVRTMLAGATGIDLALLVVAADDSVKPQTREHLEILRLLDLRAGVIALTKCDLVEPEWIDLVEMEVRELVQGTFLSAAPIIRTSVVRGMGLDTLREALTRAAANVLQVASERRCQGPFRMAIDRAFTISGHGTVVTGSVQNGQARVGQKLIIQPGDVEVRVRSLENHQQAVATVHRGQRAAMNLAGIHHGEIRRGQEVATPGFLVPSTRLTVRLDLLARAPRPLRNRARVRLHLGTAEGMARAVLLEADTLGPGQTSLAQLVLAAPMVAVWNQPFVVRSESPVTTMGGGVVLDPCAEKVRRGDTEKLDYVRLLTAPEPPARASAALFLAGWRGWQADDLARTAGVTDVAAGADQLRRSGDLVDLPVSPTRCLHVHRQVLEQTFRRVEQVLARLHRQSPLQADVARTQIAHQFEYLGPPAVVDAILEKMVAAGRIVRHDDRVACPGFGPRLSGPERQLLDELIRQIESAAFCPPTLGELQAQTRKHRAAIPELIQLAVARGQLVRITDTIFLHQRHFARLPDLLRAAMTGSQGLTLSQIREILGTTRKYAVPICELLDRLGMTRRDGDLRVVATRIEGSRSMP